MDEIASSNRVRLCGVIADVPVLSHENREERFYIFPLEVERLSGAMDRVNVILREASLPLVRHSVYRPLGVEGELRSFNNRSGQGSKLVITVFARELSLPSSPVWENTVELEGTLCKPPTLRVTPMGREISDLMLAVNRAFGKSDYIPCIAWGRTARYAAQLSVGDHLEVQGRFQSREYQKQLPDGTVINRMAYEVSLSRLTCVRDIPLASPAAVRENALQ